MNIIIILIIIIVDTIITIILIVIVVFIIITIIVHPSARGRWAGLHDRLEVVISRSSQSELKQKEIHYEIVLDFQILEQRESELIFLVAMSPFIVFLFVCLTLRPFECLLVCVCLSIYLPVDRSFSPQDNACEHAHTIITLKSPESHFRSSWTWNACQKQKSTAACCLSLSNIISHDFSSYSVHFHQPKEEEGKREREMNLQ